MYTWYTYVYQDVYLSILSDLLANWHILYLNGPNNVIPKNIMFKNDVRQSL